MGVPAERRYVLAKLSYEELRQGVRLWPDDRELRAAFRRARHEFNIARRGLHVSRNGR